MIHWPSQHILVGVDHGDPLVAVGLATVLSGQGDMEVGTPSCGRSERAVQVVVADYERGVRWTERRTRGQAAPRVLIVTGNDREHDVRAALEAGVEGYLELACHLQELLDGVRQLARGSRYLSAMAAQRVAASMARSNLTEREQQVLRLVARGQSNKGVALALEISAGTVKAHMKAILSKLDAQTRTEAASIAMQRGLIGAAIAA